MSRKKITDEFLHYGSCVSLSLQESAFVHSTGFIDSSLYLSPLSEIHDFSQCLFRVLPLSIHTVQNELISSLESQDLAEYQEKYLALMEKLQGECTTNKQAYQKVKGEVVRFGTLVYLQHVESHKFLTLHPKETGTADRDTFKISLNDFPNDFSYFALQPSYNFQKEGDSIIRNSDVIILEIILAELNKPAYLAASEKLIEIESTKFEAKEISASLDHKSRWTLNLFSQTQLDKANCIKFGDFIWISHSEGAAVLISSIKEQNGVISFDNKLTNSNGLWKVENENETMGGYLYSGKVCRLKHMSTGLYFSVRLDDSGTQVANLTYKKHASSLWVFEQIYSQNKSVKICSDQFCSLVNFKYQVKLQGNNFKDPLVNIQVEFTNDNSEASYFKIFKSDENYLWESKFVLSCIPVLGPLPAFISEYSGKKYEDSYWAIKKFVKRMELVCICLKEIDLFVQNKQKSSVIFGRTKGLFNKTRQQFVRELGILDILSEILNCSFVGDLSLNKTLTIEKSEFKNKMSLFDQIQVNLDKDISTILLRELVHMVSLIYKVISTTCKDNLDNQMYAFRFFSIFQNHAGYHLGATCCMAGMLKNNETMLMHLQKGWANINLENGYSVIRHYIWLLRKFSSERKPHLLDFLTMICTCFDSGVSINQEKVHEKIFFNAETYNKAVILNSIDNENNLILLLKHREGFGEENVNMFRNFLNGEIIDYHKDIKYMISLMQLFSALCRGRNFICKASVSNWFSLDLLINNIWNENLSHELRATLLDMLMSMHIDFQPRSYLPKPELIRTLENHSLDYMKNNFSNRHKILSIDSGFEIKLLPSKKTQSTTRNRRKSSILLDDFTIIPEKDEQALFNLKCELIVFFENLQNFEFNILVFQMLKLANMLIRFEVISTECCNITTQRCVYSFKSQDFSNDNMDIVRLLRSAVKILFIGPEQELVFKYSSKKNSSFSGLLVKNNINYQDQIRILKKSVDFSQDPFVKYIDGVQDYIEMQMTSSDVSNESDTIEVQCKLQLCDMLLQALNLRQDYLINNFIEWYKKENTFTTEKFSELFPPILKSGKQSAKNKFVTVFQPVFESITEIHPDLLGELLHSFMSANNYKLKTKLLEIILRLASQRKEFLKFLLKVKIMTGESDPEEFLSAKINISTLRNLVEQSEIICRYWGQSAGLFEKTSEKLDTLALLLINFEEIMHGNLDAKNEIKSGIDKDRQTMLKNLGFHTYVISLIRDGFHILEEIYEDCQKIHVKEARERLVGLFSLCFKTLRTFVYKNPRNQKALYANIGVICMNLRIQVHQIDLLCELFRDNSELCSYITEDFLQQFIDLIVSEGRQTVFLEFFEAITEINSVANLNIKRMILMLMCQPEVFYHVFYMETEGKFTFEISEQYVDQPYVYHAKLINILAKCGTSTARFQLTREKCQKIVPISEIFHLLTQDNIEFNALEYPLLNFFLKIYLSSDLEELENNENFLQTIEFKTDSLQKYLDRETNQLKEIEKWIEVIEVYTVKFMTGDYLKNTSFFILNYLAALGEKWEKIRELGISHKSVKRLKIISNLLNADFTKETEAEIEEMVFHKSMISEGQKKWAEILKVISDAKHKKFIKKEQVKSLKSIFHLQNQNSGATRSTIINSMIHYISFALDYTPPIDILCSLIRMLGLYLDNYHDETGKSNKKDIQEEYKKFGIVEIILSLMCSKQLDKRIFDVLIGFSNKLLEGGNENVQADFYEFFISMSTSENFFYRVHKMIAEYTQSLDSISDKNLKHISIYKRSTKAMSNITRLLQLFCENHNEVLQNYIRIQIRSRNSFDLVESVIILLQELMKRKKPESFHIIRHCFEMLIECIQGPCKQNQKAIINSKFLEVASNILSIDENSATNQNYYALNDLKENNEQTENEYMQGWMISHLKYKCLTMLMALLEGQTDNYIIIRMARAFNLLIFKENILSVFKMYLDMNKSEEYNEKLFNHFEQNQGYIFNSKKNPQDENSKYYTFVIENGFLVYYLLNLFYSIEDDEVQKMLFLDLPELCERKRQCSLKSGEKVGLAGQTQKMLMQNLKLLQNLIKSESQQGDSEILNKAFDFFEKNTGYIEVIFKGTLCSAYFWLPPVCHHLTIEVIDEFHSKVDRTSDKTKIESLLNYSNEVIEDMKYEEKLSMVYGYKLMTKWVRRFKILVFVLTILLNLVIILSYSDYGGDRLYGPSYLNVEITSNKSDRVTSTKALLLSVGLIHCILSGFIFLTFIIKTAPIIIQRLWRKQAKNSENSAKSSKCTHCLNNFKFFLLTCFYTLSNMDILYQLLYFTFAILGVAVHPFFFSAHLIDVFYRFPSLQSIVMAIVLPWRSLLLTLIFILVIVYFFSIWAYMQFNADFLDGCRSLLLCMKSVFDLGFKQSGGIGMWLDNIYEPPAGEIIYSRFFFDNLFTIILLWIMMNIIQGIIIVNFSVVRERQNSNFEDINNKCFICGKDRETIEKLTGNSFYQHRTYEHNEWNYVFFLAYLNFKQAIEYSGVESEIMQKITQKNIDWVPQQCMSFNKIKIEETDITESLISAQEQIKNLQQDLKHFKSKSLNDESRIF